MKFFSRRDGFPQKYILIAVSLCFLHTTNLFAQSGSALTFSEIMFSPSETNGEFVEIYNTSATEIIDLTNYKFKYSTSSNNNLVAFIGGLLLGPGKYAVILQGNYDYNNGIYKTLIPSDVIILKTGSNNFGSAGMNNTVSNTLLLINAADITVDTYTYSANNSAGYSDEKMILNKNNDASNWKNSSKFHGTPGRINSVAIKKFDLSIKSISSQTRYPSFGEEINLAAKVINLGINPASSFTVKFFVLSNDAWNFFTEESGSNLSPSDSTFIISKAKLKLDETKTIMCKVSFSADEDTLNNSLVAEINPGSKPNAVLINEVMHDPLTGETEWIEIVNASAGSINLKTWQVSDLLTSPTKATITVKDVNLLPGEYAIIAYDTLRYRYVPPKKFLQAKFGALSSTDGVILYDFRGAVIDSLKYNSTWGSAKGFSLERISLTEATNDSTNWAISLSPNGGTPGVCNSVVETKKYPVGSLVINEIMFDPATGNSEYLEFFNTSSDSIQVGGMQINVGTSYKFKLAKTYLMLSPKNYFVLAADSAIYKNYSWLKGESISRVAGSSSLSLSNEGSMLVLKDFRKNTLDSLIYSPDWHSKNVVTTKNKSLERLNPAFDSNKRSNWNTAVSMEGGSPGRQNSIFVQNLSHESKVTISPNPFSPDGDGFEDFAVINFDLTHPLSQVRIKVFDSQGRIVRTLAENRPSSSNNSVVFDGLDDSGNPLRIGIYILLIEAVAEGSGNVEVIKTPVVVARKL